jgi:hypothetical protein
MNKLKKAKDDLYEKILDDELLIKLNDVLTLLINGLNKFIDQIGGLGNVALILVGLFGRTLFPLITNGFKQLGNNISIWTGQAAKNIANMQNNLSASMQDLIDNGQLTEGVKQQMELSQKVLKMKQELMLSSKNMTEAEKAEAEQKI